MITIIIKKGDVILFQGDSITEWGRDGGSHQLGFGYADYAASFLQSQYPQLDLTFVNRGISGNRSADLVNRWTQDCIDIKPDVVSILIGINDTWRRYDSNDPTTAAQYYNNFRAILERTRLELPKTRIIIFEPFLLYTTDKLNWREDLDPKIQKARQLAMEFGTIYIPLDGIFAKNSAKVDPSFWSADGVHPSPAGHALIARHYINAVE